MKKTLLGLFAGLIVSAVTGRADSPIYKTLSGAAGTTSSEVIFPADPVTQIRVVSVFGSSDKVASVFSFRGGTTVVSISASNPAGTKGFFKGCDGPNSNR